MESTMTHYPVIFFDGERKHDKGYIDILSLLTFKLFRSDLSQRVGIPPNRLSIIFISCRKQSDVEKRHRLPINGNTNFSVLLNQHNPSKEKDCHFFVTVKKSKKERKRKSRKRAAGDSWTKGDPFVAGSGPYMSRSMHPQELCSVQHMDEGYISYHFGEVSFGDDAPYDGVGISLYSEQQAPMQGEWCYSPAPQFMTLQQEDTAFEWKNSGPFLCGTQQLMNPYHNASWETPQYYNPYFQGFAPSTPSMHPTQNSRRLNSSGVGAFSSRVMAPSVLDQFQLGEANIVTFGALPVNLQSLENPCRESGCQICSECKHKNICPVPFHWCIGDTITQGFQGPSPAGPIGRHSKPVLQI